MNYLKCDCATYCIGQACSMGAVLLAALLEKAKPTAGFNA
jgi:ATP-dependent protease ClpP protease subunit